MMSIANGHAQSSVAVETIKKDLSELQSALDGVRRQSTTAIERQILSQPFQSVAVAFAAGFVVSRLFARKLF
jgi:ElaB/YqjD/DUF883 family membrane-anchored ribosome-binding protein